MSSDGKSTVPAAVERMARYHECMAIFLDDEAVRLEGSSLADVLQSAQQKLECHRRVIVEVQLDGQALSGDQIEQQQTSDVSAAELRLYSANPAEVAVETLEQVRYRLASVRQTQADAADMLQQDRSAEALQKVAESVEGWMQTQQAISMAASLTGISLEQLNVDGQPVSDITNNLVAALTNMKDLLAAGDTVAMADALAYEWPEYVDTWDRLVERLIDKLEGDEAGA